MITFIKGDIFNSPAQVITNTVNTEGVMGKGIALAFKKRFPGMYEAYKRKCESGEFNVGNLMLYKEKNKWILLFPTKKEWRKNSKMEYIESGLAKLADNWDKLGIHSIALPKLGCGNGGLEWREVKALMIKYLSRIPIDVYIYTDEYKDKAVVPDNISELEKWGRGELELEGYDLFKHNVINELNDKRRVILPEGHFCELDDDDNVVIDGEKVMESEIIWAWNFVRNSKVVSKEDIEKKGEECLYPILELMIVLHYASRIYASKDDGNYSREPNAYQYIAA